MRTIEPRTRARIAGLAALMLLAPLAPQLQALPDDRDQPIYISSDRADRDEPERRRYYELSASGRSVALVELARLRTLVDRVSRTLGGGALA